MEIVEENSSIKMNPVELFEKAFQACISVVTKEDTLSNLDHDEIRIDTEDAINDLMEKARSVESYFLKKRLQIANLKPELIVKEETNDLRSELLRKEELLKRNYDKIAQWQSMLADVQSTPGNVSQQQSSDKRSSGTPLTNPPGITPPITSGPGGPLTPGGTSRSQTPGSVGRPQTPMGGPLTPGGGRGYQPQQASGLQGPLAYLEKTASTIGMNP